MVETIIVVEGGRGVMVLAQYLYDKLVVPQRERMREEAAARKARMEADREAARKEGMEAGRKEVSEVREEARKEGMEAGRKEGMEAGREEVIRALHRDWRRRRREALLQGEPFNEPSPIDRLRECGE
jgi:hypothetical protein